MMIDKQFMHRIFEAILDDYTPDETQNGANKVRQNLADQYANPFLREFAKYSPELEIPSSDVALQIQILIDSRADNDILRKLLFKGGTIYEDVLDYSQIVSNRSKVLIQSTTGIDNIDDECMFMDNGEDMLSLTCSFSIVSYAKSRDIARLLIRLMRNILKFKDVHPMELETVRFCMLKLPENAQGTFDCINLLEENDFEEQLDNGLVYEKDSSLYFLTFLMQFIHVHQPDFPLFDPQEFEKQYVAGTYFKPFYRWIDSYLKRENKRWKR